MKRLSQELEMHVTDNCVCAQLNLERLRGTLDHPSAQHSIFDMLQTKCPTMFAACSVRVLPRHAERMERLIEAVAVVVALPAFRQAVLAKAPAVAQHAQGASQGVFFGYDFHIDGDDVSLIEINTNAGGALLNAALAAAHGQAPIALWEDKIISMFLEEWKLAGRQHALRTIAIVDEEPTAQYFHAEFLMFQRLFEAHGVRAVIASPDSFTLRDGLLWHGDTPIDLIYNRLCDFLLETPAATVLRKAYLCDAAVLTPHPQAYALYADKRVLAWLSDPQWLAGIGVAPALQQVLLSHIPRTELLTEANAARFWAERKQYFFKPRFGFGSRGVFRGDKMSRKGWSEVLASDYVAQAFAKPGEQMVDLGTTTQSFKFDIRSYVYAGKVQQVAARLYQGIRTNFKVQGSGFAPVCRSADHSR